MNADLPDRARPAHGVLRVDSQPTIVFITVCTKDRRPLLANDYAHACLLKAWEQASAWRVGRYVVMPDHIHLFAGWFDDRFDLDRWIRYWKSLVSQAICKPDFKWQSGHWDTRMRRADQYVSKWEYVKNNPVRHRLVRDSGEWPYAAILNSLGWD